MCGSPKSSGSAKPIKAFSGSIMSGLDSQARERFTQRANIAADKRAQRMTNNNDKGNNSITYLFSIF